MNSLLLALDLEQVGGQGEGVGQLAIVHNSNPFNQSDYTCKPGMKFVAHSRKSPYFLHLYPTDCLHQELIIIHVNNLLIGPLGTIERR